MSFPSQIFKAYDIRGVYPDELDENLTKKIGQAYAEFLKKETKNEKLKVVVSYDMRNSSPQLKSALIEGITSQGVDVVDIGLSSTPTFYFAVSYYGYDGGIQVSASHNPAKYNGLKMVRARAVPISGDTGIMTIRDMAEQNNFILAENIGKVEEKTNVLQEQIRFALSYVNVNNIKPLKVVVDGSNAVGALLAEELFKYLPCKLEKLYFDLDGNFPNHEADPLKDENNLALQKRVVEINADLGIALDGDADRVFFIDNKGKTIAPAIIRGILAMIFLRENPGASICYDIRPGKITVDMIKENGGLPVVTKVGHSLIKEKAMEVGAVFAGESSGHFFVKMPHGMYEATEIVILKIIEEISLSNQTIKDYIKPLDRYFHSGEINFDVNDKEKVFSKLREKYGSNLKYDFDGLSFEWSNWWFNVRASNTENKVRLNLEAMDKETMEEKTEEVKAVILS